MVDQRYLRPRDVDFCLAHVVEECGEVLAAAGKTQRWGFESYDPTIPIEKRISNAQWLRQEIDDLKGAIERLENCMDKLP